MEIQQLNSLSKYNDLFNKIQEQDNKIICFKQDFIYGTSGFRYESSLLDRV